MSEPVHFRVRGKRVRIERDATGTVRIQDTELETEVIAAILGGATTATADVAHQLHEELQVDPDLDLRERLRKVDGARSSIRHPNSIKSIPDPLLLVLASHSPSADIRSEVARHPLTPTFVLERMVREEPSLSDSERFRELSMIAGHPRLSSATRTQLAYHPAGMVRAGVMGAPGLSRGIFDLLARDPSSLVREAVAGNDDTPLDLLSQLAGDESESVRTRVAGNRNTPGEMLLKLARDRGYEVRQRLVQNHPEVPDEVLAVIIRNDRHGELAQIISRRKQLSDAIWDQLSRHNSSDVRFAVAQHKPLPEVMVRRLAKDPSPFVRNRTATRADIPKALLLELARDPQPIVRRTLAARPHLSQELEAILAEDPDPYVRLKLASRENARAKTLDQLVDTADEELTLALARRPGDLPEHTFSVLSAHRSFEVRRTLARYMRTPGQLRRMAKDRHAMIRNAIALQPHLPLDAQLLLARDPSTTVRQSLACRHRLAPEVVTALLEKGDEKVLECLKEWNPDVLERARSVATVAL